LCQCVPVLLNDAYSRVGDCASVVLDLELMVYSHLVRHLKPSVALTLLVQLTGIPIISGLADQALLI
jgi:hypothetical protein